MNPSVVAMNGVVSKDHSDSETRIRKDFIDPETGEQVILERLIHSEKKKNIRDVKQFTKLFIEADLRGISSGGVKLLDYVVKHLKARKDEIYLPISDCMVHCAWGSNSRMAYYRALDNLLENEFLFVKKDDMNTFYVNVNKIFNGKREELYGKFTALSLIGDARTRGLIDETIELYKK